MLARKLKPDKISSKDNQLMSYKKINSFTQKQIDSIIVMDNNGYTLSNYAPNHNKDIPDNSLVSMFISAITNFSKELFDQEEYSSIKICKGDYIISIVSNLRFCAAFVGKYEADLIEYKMNQLLLMIDSMYVNIEDPRKVDNELNIFNLIKQQFFI
jgi:hypothetical protein